MLRGTQPLRGVVRDLNEDMIVTFYERPGRHDRLSQPRPAIGW